ncbi:MAG: T9SS type A sorting domain-containing protein, partial [Cytophagales bacterium]|nr:T9SS type A sorting domain-containing protein [Cytophagales bacterium]
ASASSLVLNFSDDPTSTPKATSTDPFTPTQDSSSQTDPADPIFSSRLKQSISVKPNPAFQYIEIDTPAHTHLKIIDPTGRDLHDEQVARGLHRISVRDLASGSYFLILQTETQVRSYTFIKRSW